MLNLFLKYIVPGSIFFPVIVFLPGYRSANKSLKILFAYLIVSAVINITSIILGTLHRSNLWLLHVDTIVEVIILLYFFIQIIHNGRIRSVMWALLVLFPVVCIINLLVLQPVSNFNTYTRSVEAVLIIGACACYWLQESRETLTVPWLDNPYNWIISGLLLYFASALFLFLFSNYLLLNKQSKPDDPIWDIVWVTHGGLLMVMYLLIGIGFLKARSHDR